jgi:CheY-like chemotaxis protein
MSWQSIPPFYFPTTCVFIDDSSDFLANLCLQLDPQLSYRLFDSPIDALVTLNTQHREMTLAQKYFSRYRYVEDFSLTNHVIDFDLKKIHREVYDEHRFEEVSVAVIDYVMPEIDGLEFCRQMKNPLIRKVLLTGKADEKFAVQAFNEGIIDRFIRKSDAAALTKLNQTIAELQKEYFQTAQKALSDTLMVGTPRFLHDPQFASLFRTLCAQNKIVEFYLCVNPDGMLLLDFNGTASQLIVYTEKDMQAQYEIAFDQAAPQMLLDELKSGKTVPYFWSGDGHYGSAITNWQAYLHPAQQFHGAEWYYYAIVPPSRLFGLQSILSYRAFLERLDESDDDAGLSI